MRISSGAEGSDAIKHLLDTGSAGLGGARPKASVRLPDGALAIAKFPHTHGAWDVMAWEAVALGLSGAAGVRTPDRRTDRVGDRTVLILRRFDRNSAGHRVPYIGTMTALGAQDGERRDCAETSEAVRDLSASLRADLRELFDRAVINVALGNTDDHLCNHGFLASGVQWMLSPAFDVNPVPDRWRPRATSIMGADAPPDEAAALAALAQACGIPLGEARARSARVARVISR